MEHITLHFSKIGKPSPAKETHNLDEVLKNMHNEKLKKLKYD